MTEQHPDYLELTAFALDTTSDRTVEEHVASCDTCGSIVTKLRAITPIGEQADRVDVALADTVASALSELPDPGPGQLWRVEWDGVVALVAVLTVDADGAAEVASIIDADDLDSWSVTIPRATLGWDAAILAATLVTVPARVFDRYIGQLAPLTLQRVIDVAAGAPGDGSSIDDPDDRRLRHHRTAFAELDSLSSATWLPERAAGEADALETLKQLWATPGAVAQALGVTPGKAMSILNGTIPLTDQWRSVIETAANITTAQSLPSQDLLRALDHVQVRSFWREAAQRRGVTDTPAFRWQVYEKTNFALAARATGVSQRDADLARVKQVLSELA